MDLTNQEKIDAIEEQIMFDEMIEEFENRMYAQFAAKSDKQDNEVDRLSIK